MVYGKRRWYALPRTMGYTMRQAIHTRKRKVYPKVSVCPVLSNQTNVTSNAQTIQGLLTLHCPGAVQNWQGVAYRLYAADDLRTLCTNAFSGLHNAVFIGLTATIRGDLANTYLICYKDTQISPFRVITGLGMVKGSFRFKEMPYALALIGETDCSTKLKFAYKPLTVKSTI